jgi:hypothetical protein
VRFKDLFFSYLKIEIKDPPKGDTTPKKAKGSVADHLEKCLPLGTAFLNVLIYQEIKPG